MFTTGIDIQPSLDLLRDIRSKTSAIQDDVREAVKGPILTDVEAAVGRYLKPYPGDPSRPFLFATPNSRAWYFAAKRNGLFDSQTWDEADGQWDRTGALANGWVVDLDPRTTRVNTIMTISNLAQDEKGDDYSQAVYGPLAVAGHAITGWEQIVDDAVDPIVDIIEQGLQDALDAALEAFG